MAIRAHEIPVLVEAGPMQGVMIRDALSGEEEEPALAPMSRGTAVPSDAERLQASAGHRDQVLLKWIDAERIFYFVVVEATVGAVGAHHEARPLPKEGRSDRVVGEVHVIEGAEHRSRRRHLHRRLMMRAAPEIALADMAGTALRRPDKT